jgi:hypothetical protein
MALAYVFVGAPAQMPVQDEFISILGGLFHSYLDQDEERDRQRNEILERLTVPVIPGSPWLLSTTRTLSTRSTHEDTICQRTPSIRVE